MVERKRGKVAMVLVVDTEGEEGEVEEGHEDGGKGGGDGEERGGCGRGRRERRRGRGVSRGQTDKRGRLSRILICFSVLISFARSFEVRHRVRIISQCF